MIDRPLCLCRCPRRRPSIDDDAAALVGSRGTIFRLSSLRRPVLRQSGLPPLAFDIACTVGDSRTSAYSTSSTTCSRPASSAVFVNARGGGGGGRRSTTAPLLSWDRRGTIFLSLLFLTTACPSTVGLAAARLRHRLHGRRQPHKRFFDFEHDVCYNFFESTSNPREPTRTTISDNRRQKT